MVKQITQNFNNMKYIFITALLLFSVDLSCQDLYVQYWNIDQKDTVIKEVEISDVNGTRTEKNFPAKNNIELIKKFNEKGYEVYEIDMTILPSTGYWQYHIWFKKTEQNKSNDKK
jgi:hypothetical protein